MHLSSSGPRTVNKLLPTALPLQTLKAGQKADVWEREEVVIVSLTFWSEAPHTHTKPSHVFQQLHISHLLNALFKTTILSRKTQLWMQKTSDSIADVPN